MRSPWTYRSERRRWRSTRTLADLGPLMAAWLEGQVRTRPAYAAGCGPDAGETVATGLAPVLAASCRAGYVTDMSQPGHPPAPGRDGHQYTQRAFVTGFIADPRVLARLTAAADAAGPLVVRTDTTGRGASTIPVTVRDNRPCAAVGRHLDETNVRHQWEDDIGPSALSDLLGAAQVSVVDPDWGSNRLRPVLATLSKPGR